MNKLVVGNWKQNKTLSEVKVWINEFKKLLNDNPEITGPLAKVDMVVAPSFPFLHHFQGLRTNVSNFYLASQDVSVFESGRHTGDVGANQLKDYVEYSLIGHSERKEDRALVLQKGTRLFEACITPIMCFSEFDPKMYVEGTVLVWEDPDNISNDSGYREKDMNDIVEGMKKIKSQLPKSARVLYGGSVNRQNAAKLSTISELDGVLPGNASLDPAHFFEIVKAFNK
ncbi:triosephosphate isomerase [candidate division WWE3 bacterium]|nr:triosephosphate isomerase [candidate division WWE3 bacterium]